MIGSTGTNLKWYIGFELEFSPVLLFFFVLFAFLGVVVNEDGKDDVEVSGKIVLGAVAASVAIESKLLHFVIIQSKNALWRWTKI